MFLSTAKIIKKQGERITKLINELAEVGEENGDLQNENEYLHLKVRHLQEFKNKVTDIMTDKGTIVDKHDKIKELIGEI